MVAATVARSIVTKQLPLSPSVSREQQVKIVPREADRTDKNEKGNVPSHRKDSEELELAGN